ncbi:conserved hypothetical protein [Perkinsus marinus ATCC 50983]|uniref:S-adenosylmethionine-dependent methyltransferase domain-containing protein n=1 Tax=Perkinsus marinus (strain ATCC 50983 / TXsc) TaxID=423536 RepID=C5K6C5_PERM5|nr:conserved hypothetical protein [Perkinsus marinus ATCC 50983]EER19845.1 conserved hypothetical protein [Perkinsus marinus ATCC 50983]|eukprot:XP_002788049.1 conserved hypothetical protein [Perkinsus marinus ATCC 50983]
MRCLFKPRYYCTLLTARRLTVAALERQGIPVVRIAQGTAAHQKHYVHRNLILNWDQLSTLDENAPVMCGISVAGKAEVVGWGMLTTGPTARSFALRVMHDTTLDGSLGADPFGDPLEAISQWFAGRLVQAMAARMHMLDTSIRRCYRLLNYEGDGLTGVALDVYEHIAVVYVSAQWVCLEGLKERLEGIVLGEVPQVERVLWRFRRDLLAADGGGGDGDGEAKSDDSVILTIEENSLKFSVEVGGGKKTGWFLDQSDNRRKLMEYVRMNKVDSVADLCCYTGAFAIHAAAGGARRVVGVDIQEKSITNAKVNADLNGNNIASKIDWLTSDVGDFCRNGGTEEFDLIILDPPNIVKGGRGDDHGLRALRKLTELSLGRINKSKGGCLWVFSCSHELSKEGVLEEVVGGAAVRSGRRVRIAEQLGASVDHMYSPYHANSKHLRGLVVMVEPEAAAKCNSHMQFQ